MEIIYKDIILRDYKEDDIADDIRWMTKETAWHDWDAPWEAEEALANFNSTEYHQKAITTLKVKKEEDDFRWQFEIDTKDGVHIGGVNTYLNDKDYNWKSESEGGCLYTIGIDICEPDYWYKGYGSQAFIAFINYYFSQGITDIYTETWSGNYPMITMAKKIGFEVWHKTNNCLEVHGKIYDNLIFKLNIKNFNKIYNL